MTNDSLTASASIRVRRPASDVFDAFVDSDAMSKFWFTRRDDGLKQGESVTWYLGNGEDAFSFDVRVLKLERPGCIVIEWGEDGSSTRVEWTIDETEDGDTILRIEESGFRGSDDEIIERALDSTGGFNQVVVAAKAFIEHRIALNVVTSHV